jgi:hypothetical protein
VSVWGRKDKNGVSERIRKGIIMGNCMWEGQNIRESEWATHQSWQRC